MKKFVAALTAVCCLAGVGASGASATSEFFYKENLLGSLKAVSGTPHENVNFVGAYSNSGLPYAVAECEGGCSTVRHYLSGSGTSVTESFAAEPGFWEGWLKNEGGSTGRFTAEERF
jgi:hypothetical protein